MDLPRFIAAALAGLVCLPMWAHGSVAPGIGTSDTQPDEPLAVQLLAFDAVLKDGVVVLSWQTGSEIDNEGFNVLRTTNPVGEFEPINAQLIPAQGGPALGASYRLIDRTVRPKGTYYYMLEDIDTTGTVTLRGADACLFSPFDPTTDCAPLVITVDETGTGPSVSIPGVSPGPTGKNVSRNEPAGSMRREP